MLDTSQIDQIISKLEELEDEQLAVELLREFNERTKRLGVLILNQDESLSHDVWKEQCDQAKKDVDEIVERIQKL